MKRKGITVLQLIIVIAVSGIIVILLMNNFHKEKSEKSELPVTNTQSPVAVTHLPEKETKILPSDIEDSFQQPEYNIDFVSKDSIPRLKVREEKQKRYESSSCNEDDSLFDSTFNPNLGPNPVNSFFYDDCKKKGYKIVNGIKYNCRIKPNGFPKVDHLSEEKVEGKALELLYCDKVGFFELNGKKFSCPFHPKGITYEECLKVKDKLGIKECFDPRNPLYVDSWAGLVKQCGGVEYVPTMKDIAEISSLIYEGNPSLGPYEDKYVKYKKGLHKYMVLWSNEEHGQHFCIRIHSSIITQDALFYRNTDGDTRGDYSMCILK